MIALPNITDVVWTIMCLGAIVIAVSDIYGKFLNQPVYFLLGGAQCSYYQTPKSIPEIEIIPYCTVVSIIGKTRRWRQIKLIIAQSLKALDIEL